MFGLTGDEAIAALHGAGHHGSISDDTSLCGSVVDGRVIEIGQVCYQHPPPGRVQGARLPVSLRVQTENPWHGNAGKVGEWHLMPNVVGMSVEQARTEMKRVGFERDDRVQLHWVEEPDCKPLVVCRTYPEAMQRAGVSSDKIIFAGRDPNARSPAEPTPDKPAPDKDKPSPDQPAKTPAATEPFF